MGVARRTVSIIPDNYRIKDKLSYPYSILIYLRRLIYQRKNKRMVCAEVEERFYTFKIYNFRKRKLRRLNYSYSAFCLSKHHYRC